MTDRDHNTVRVHNTREAKRISGHMARIGMILDNRYELQKLLGHGGMGAVYKARHIEIDRAVAIKMLLPEVADDPEMCKRFLREAKASGKINHPNVVQLTDYGQGPEGEAFIVIEYLDGVGLDQLIDQQDHLEPHRAVDIFAQICDGVGNAHAKGIIHRDLKPSNVMLVNYDGNPDFVKVVDFGLAKALDPAEESQKLTNSGEIFGSPIYMAPEQCLGHQLDSRSDIYALGILMYECLTGKVPFLGAVFAETIARQMNEIPKSFAEIRPDLEIPESLELVVMKALSKNPEERQSSMQELKDELMDAMLPKLKAKNKKTTNAAAKMKPLAMGFNDRHGSTSGKSTVSGAKPRKATIIYAVGAALGLGIGISTATYFLTKFNQPSTCENSPSTASRTASSGSTEDTKQTGSSTVQKKGDPQSNDHTQDQDTSKNSHTDSLSSDGAKNTGSSKSPDKELSQTDTDKSDVPKTENLDPTKLSEAELDAKIRELRKRLGREKLQLSAKESKDKKAVLSNSRPKQSSHSNSSGNSSISSTAGMGKQNPYSGRKGSHDWHFFTSNIEKKDSVTNWTPAIPGSKTE